MTRRMRKRKKKPCIWGDGTYERVERPFCSWRLGRREELSAQWRREKWGPLELPEEVDTNVPRWASS